MLWFHRQHHADHFRKVAIGFFVLSLLLVGVVFYISYAWVTITVTPRAVSMSEGFEFEVVDASASPSSDQLQGGVITEEREVKGTFLASGETAAPIVQRTQGSITILNQSGSSQQLRATTRLLSPDGTLFRTTSYIVVPAGGRVEAPVIADEVKEFLDLSSARFTLPGLRPERQSQIYGLGFSPSVSGGSFKKAVAQADIDAAIQSLQIELKTQEESVLGQTSRYVISVQPKTIAKSADVGDKAESFTVRLSATVQVVSYDATEFRARVNQLLLKRLPPGYDLIPASDADITLQVQSVDSAAKKATVKAIVRTDRIRNSDFPDLEKSSFSGLSADGIASYFRSFDDIEDVNVRFYPLWITSAPYLTDHISILVKR